MTDFDAFIFRHQSALRRFIARRVNDSHAVDDLTQDVLLKLHRHGAAGDDGRRVRWMFTTARNAVIDHYRSRNSTVEVPVNEAAAAAKAEVNPALQLGRCVGPLIEHLPGPYRQAMLWTHQDGLTQAEVAVRAGLSLSGAKSRVQRARDSLRELLLDCCDVQTDIRGNVIDAAATVRTARYCNAMPDCAPCGQGHE